MKKAYRATIFAIVIFCFLPVSVQAKSLGENTYKICKNDIFTDYDNLNVKKIVTEVKDDGTFTAIDLSEWLNQHDVCDISVVEEKEGIKELFYKFNSEKMTSEYHNTDETSYINFQALVREGELINSTETSIEEVTYVNADGSFYTKVLPAGFDVNVIEEDQE